MMTHMMMRPNYLIVPTLIFEGDGLDTKDKKNRVCQGGPWKRNKIKKWENETPGNEHVGANPYASMNAVAAVHTMLPREPVPMATIRVITSLKIKVRESSYELDSHDDTCVFGRGTLIVYDFNQPVNVQGYEPILGSSEYSTVTGMHGYLHHRMGMTYHIVTHQWISIPHLEHHLLYPMQDLVNYVTINETPRFLTHEPNGETH